jgi:2-polyprenyl-3-methyl-5-hydroxy-6-metoxy-1,4-benzoquinol methylase
VTARVAGVVGRIRYAGKAYDWLRGLRPSAAYLTRRNTLAAYNSVYASDRLLSEYLSPERLEFYEELVTILVPYSPRRIVDVGCGTGHLLRVLVDRMPARPERVVGLDHSDAGIRRAQLLLPSATWVVDDLYGLSSDFGQFDLVLCTEVLEHVHQPTHAVEALRRLCAPDGRIAITVPDGAQDSWEGHVNFWDEPALRAFLTPHGRVEIHRIQKDDVLFAWLVPGDS